MSEAPTSRTPLYIGLGIGGCLLLVVLGAVAVPFLGIIGAIAIPNYVAMSMKAERAEVPSNVDGIKTAQLAYDAAFDGFVDASSRAEAEREISGGAGREPRPWGHDPGFNTIGWRPDGDVRGAYWVEVQGNDFTVHGICDVDGDGQYAEYTATSSINSTLITSPDVY
jgi:hypothetical protein